MSITATVENDTIKLPEGVHLPDGTTVSIEPIPPDAGSISADGAARRAHMEAWLKRAVGAGETGLTTDEIMRMTRDAARYRTYFPGVALATPERIS